MAQKQFGTPIITLPDGPKPIKLQIDWTLTKETIAALKEIDRNARESMARAHLFFLD